MFGIGASEVFITALIALMVLGPERLPKAARFAGLWLRRARAHWASVRAELERELEAESLKQGMASPLHDLAPQMRELDRELREALDPAAAARAAASAAPSSPTPTPPTDAP